MIARNCEHSNRDDFLFQSLVQYWVDLKKSGIVWPSKVDGGPRVWPKRPKPNRTPQVSLEDISRQPCLIIGGEDSRE